jgi:hypothetical protein
VGVRRRGLFCVRGGEGKDGDTSSTTLVKGGGVAPRKFLGSSPAAAISRSNSSPTRKCLGGVNSSGGTRCPSVDTNSEGNPSTTGGSVGLINDSLCRYSKTPRKPHSSPMHRSNIGRRVGLKPGPHVRTGAIPRDEVEACDAHWSIQGVYVRLDVFWER